MEYNSKIPLTSRIYPRDEPVPIDKDNWKQCIDYGTIYPVYEIQKEPQIKDVVSMTENPFDEGKDFLGIDSIRGLRKKRQNENFDYVEDNDLKKRIGKRTYFAKLF